MFKDYNLIKIGDSAKLEKKITEIDIKKFVEMTGDDNRLHVDKEYAKTTPFKDIVVHGMIGASFISTIIGTRLPGDGALWISQTLEFLLPVRLGDELTILATVISKLDRERILELETKVLNQSGQVVLSGVGKVKVLEIKTPELIVKVEKNKVAIVSGGAGGIGNAICLHLAKAGYKIVVNYLKSDVSAQNLVLKIQEMGGKAAAIKANISKKEEAQELVEKTVRLFDGISLLVNNASPKIVPKIFENMLWEDFTEHLDVQLKGTFNLLNACVPIMKNQHYGKVVNITSQVLDSNPTQGWVAYAVGKSALSTYSKYLASELGPFGIHVNCISPGMTDTEFIGNIPEKARLITARQAPLRRLAIPDDVAAAVVFLASESSNFITGETLRVNGGQAML